MRRIHVVFAALAIVVTSFAAFSGPAMAQDDLNCRDARGDLIRCDGELYEPYYNTSGYNDYPRSTSITLTTTLRSTARSTTTTATRTTMILWMSMRTQLMTTWTTLRTVP